MTEHTLSTPQIKRLERSRDGKYVAGVAAGLGRYFDLTPAVFRLGFVVLTLLGGAGILVYLAAVLVIPKEGEERSIAEDALANRRDHPWRLVALGLAAVAILSLLARSSSWPSTGAAWVLILVAGVIFLWTSRKRGARGIVVALATLFALFVVAVLTAVVVAFSWFDVSLGDGVGNHTYTPTTAASYDLGVGKLELNLTKLPADRPDTVRAHVGVGDLRIVVPRNATPTVNTFVKAGSVDALGEHQEGTHVRLVTGNGVMTVIAKVGAGHIEVVRAR
jgi:phage shock protein PspC (stress-responsive transcriptional regulator)